MLYGPPLERETLVCPDHWDLGPLELVSFDIAGPVRMEELRLAGLACEWNRSYRGGFVRPDYLCDDVFKLVPRLRESKNPNVFLLPRMNNCTALHAALSSVLPSPCAREYGINKVPGLLWLSPPRMPPSHHARVEAAFERYIWSLLARRLGGRRLDFGPDSPVSVLAGDPLFWMNRLLRLSFSYFEEGRRTPTGDPMCWEYRDDHACERVVHDLIQGAGVLETLEPVLELLRSHRVHEDFSPHYSWIKEDFERSFYSKRARVRVKFVETVDDAPAWATPEPEGYGNILFRDMLAFLDERERLIVLSLRNGKTVSEIAREAGHRDHTTISKRLKRIKEKARRLLR